tara:strand:- start:331 stop:870 length:540 start_codon:yes stop_codon:yes gene_type:complete
MSTITQLVQLVGEDATAAYNADKAATLAAVQADTIAKGVIDEAYNAMEAAADAAEVAAGTIRETNKQQHQAKCIDTINKMQEEGFGIALDAVAEFSAAITDWSDTHNSELANLVTGENDDLAAFQAEVGNVIDAALGFSSGLGEGFYVEEGEEEIIWEEVNAPKEGFAAEEEAQVGGEG